jgi:oxygen-dependent protoporphyrinogen oxidase
MAARRLHVAVVGGGISGLALGHRLLGRAEVTVLEAAECAGGHATTVLDQGFLVEAGPAAFLDRHGGPRRLARELGLEDQLVPARPSSRRRFVVRAGRLHRIPDSPASLLATGVLSPLGKLRLMLEPWVGRARGRHEETVHEFARRRGGREAAETLADAVVAGSIAAGDSRVLSLPAAFPFLARMEHERGSLLRALVARPRPGAPAPGLVAFRGGMSQLVAALTRALGPRLRTGARVEGIERMRTGGGAAWQVFLAGNGVEPADRVALALPAHAAARIVQRLDPRLAAQLAEPSFAGVVVVALAYRASDLPAPLEGAGYSVPRCEGMATLGVVFDSSLFPERAPDGFVLVRALLGGTRHPGLVGAPAELQVTFAHRELARVLGITAAPVRSWTFAWPDAIAQYAPGHRERVGAARLAATRHPGLLLCGTSYEGITFGEAVEAGRAHADAILAGRE